MCFSLKRSGYSISAELKFFGPNSHFIVDALSTSTN